MTTVQLKHLLHYSSHCTLSGSTPEIALPLLSHNKPILPTNIQDYVTLRLKIWFSSSEFLSERTLSLNLLIRPSQVKSKYSALTYRLKLWRGSRMHLWCMLHGCASIVFFMTAPGNRKVNWCCYLETPEVLAVKKVLPWWIFWFSIPGAPTVLTHSRGWSTSALYLCDTSVRGCIALASKLLPRLESAAVGPDWGQDPRVTLWVPGWKESFSWFCRPWTGGAWRREARRKSTENLLIQMINHVLCKCQLLHIRWTLSTCELRKIYYARIYDWKMLRLALVSPATPFIQNFLRSILFHVYFTTWLQICFRYKTLTLFPSTVNQSWISRSFRQGNDYPHESWCQSTESGDYQTVHFAWAIAAEWENVVFQWSISWHRGSTPRCYLRKHLPRVLRRALQGFVSDMEDFNWEEQMCKGGGEAAAVQSNRASVVRRGRTVESICDVYHLDLG
jgi:hypothetical protein